MTSKNSFAVVIPSKERDPQGFYKKNFVELLQSPKYNKLTIAGIDIPTVLRGIQHAGPDTLLTVGTAKNHDINWIERPTYACERGIEPIFDLVKDWNTVTNKLDTYYNEKYPKFRSFTASTCAVVEVYPHFIKVGNNVYPWQDKQSSLTDYDLNLIIATMKTLR